jgi:hypothetical protein
MKTLKFIIGMSMHYIEDDFTYIEFLSGASDKTIFFIPDIEEAWVFESREEAKQNQTAFLTNKKYQHSFIFPVQFFDKIGNERSGT